MDEDGLYICYQPKKFTSEHLKVIEQVEAVLAEFKGYSLTVRQMHYQFVARDWMANTDRNYQRLGGIINDARLAGLLPWDAFEDRGRNLMGHRTLSGPREMMAQAISEYKLDLWARQDYRPEVWVEKQALEGVVGEICSHLRVDFYATKGYNSQSEQWRAGRRLADYVKKGQTPIVFHLGDHDPSGIDMTRDNQDRLSLFAGVPIMVVRLGLNMDQIERYRPPPNYVKVNGYGEYADSRAKEYVRTFGTEESWELDALSPRVIRDTIEENVLRLRNSELWDEALEEETLDIRHMTELMMEQFPAEEDEQ